MGTNLKRREIFVLDVTIKQLLFLQEELSDCPEWEPGKFLPGLLEEATIRLEELLDYIKRYQEQ